MQHDVWGSSPSATHNDNSSGLPGNNCFPSPTGLEGGKGTVPLQVYQQAAEELESARQQMSRLSLENQHLRALQQQLSGEIAALEQEFQEHLNQILKRLQQLKLQLADSSQQAATSQGGTTAAPWQRDNPTSSPYDFLDRLKQRQGRRETSSFPGNSYSPTPGLATPPFNLLRRAYSFTSPLYRCQETPAEPPSHQAGYQVPCLEELIQETGGRDLHPSTGVYQRIREQHHSSQGSPLLWMAAAILLVVGSFGLGFVAVQPFLRGSSPSLQAPR